MFGCRKTYRRGGGGNKGHRGGRKSRKVHPRKRRGGTPNMSSVLF